MTQNLECESWKTPRGVPTYYFIHEFMCPESVTPAANNLVSPVSQVLR